jgi:hypothetical protein
MAVVIGSSEVLDEGVSIPRRTRFVMVDPSFPEIDLRAPSEANRECGVWFR